MYDPGIFHDIKLHTRVYQCLSKCKIGFSYNLETRFAFRQYMCGRGQGKWEGIGRVNVKYESHQQWRLSITTLLDHTNKKNTRKMKSYNILWLRYPSEIYKSVNALSPQIIKLHKCPRRSLTTNTGSEELSSRGFTTQNNKISRAAQWYPEWDFYKDTIRGISNWLTCPTTSLVTAVDDCLSQWIRPVLHVGVSDFFLGDDPSQSPDTGRRQWARPGLPLTDSAV